jgi:hypothetical protein
VIAALAPVLASAPAFCGPIEFVGAAGAVRALFSTPSDPCVPRLPAWELSVGEGTYNRFAAKRAEFDCRAAFAAAARDFTDEEREMLTRYVARVDSAIHAELPALNRLPWRFAVIADSSDFGIPASDKYIVLTTGLLKEMQEWMKNQTSMLFVGMEILIHEKVGLLQQSRASTFEKFYSEAWGFRKIPALSIDRLMQASGIFLTRFPPNEWVIKFTPSDKEYIMPALLLRDAGKGGGGTVQRVAVVIDSTSKGFFPRKSKKTPLEYKDLRAATHYRKKFPLSEYDYHPAELSADLLAKYIVMKYVSSGYGTHPAKVSEYSQIDLLMKMLESEGNAKRF